MKKVLIADYPFESVEIETEILAEAGAEVVAAQCRTDEEALPLASDVSGIIHSAAPITRRLMEAAPKCLIVAHYGVGVDNIDVEAATELGIIVTNVPGYCVDEVSDHTLALLLACARKLVALDRTVRDGAWDYQQVGPIHRIRGRILGLVGLGRIGRVVAQKAQAFGLRVICHDPFVDPEEGKSLGVEMVSLEELLRNSDFVSLHLPLSKKTEKLIGEKELQAMNPTAFLINTSRRGLVDNQAVIRALKEGWIAGAGSDVMFDGLPFSADEPALDLPNLILTPHAGWYSEESKAQLQGETAQEVARVLKGEKPVSMVNPEVWPRSRARR